MKEFRVLPVVVLLLTLSACNTSSETTELSATSPSTDTPSSSGGTDTGGTDTGGTDTGGTDTGGTDTGGTDTGGTDTGDTGNSVPIANNDSASVDEDASVSGDLSGNDSGLEDGDITFSLQSGPANGRATVSSNGRFTYTPSPDYYGTDSFTYAVSDADGDTATATVSLTISPVNDVPVAAADGASIAQGESAAIAVLDNDTGLGDGIGSISVTQPSNGSATVGTDNVVTYTPDSAFHGSDSFSYTVRDANGDQSVASIAVMVECTSCGQATLSWDPPTTNTDGSELTDLAAYNVYYGTAPEELSNQIRVADPTATTYTVGGLSGGWTYYFEVTAENSTGAESSPSNQVSKAVSSSGL